MKKPKKIRRKYLRGGQSSSNKKCRLETDLALWGGGSVWVDISACLPHT